MWMQHRAERVRPWWEQVRGLGFAQIELSHIVTPAMLEGLQAGDVPNQQRTFPRAYRRPPTRRSPDRVEVLPHLEWALYQRYYGGYQGMPIYQQTLDEHGLCEALDRET